MKKKKTTRKTPKVAEMITARAASLYWLGYSINSIAEELERSNHTILRAIQSNKGQQIFKDLDENEVNRIKEERKQLSKSFICLLRDIDRFDYRYKTDLIKTMLPFLIQKPTETIQNQQVSPEIIKFIADLKNAEMEDH